MAENNKKKAPQVEAPVVKQPEKKETTLPAETETKVNVPGIPQGLDQNHKADLIGYAQHRKDEMVRNNEANAEKYKAFTMLEDALFLDVAMTEAVVKKNPMGCILTMNEANYNGILLPLAEELKVNLPSYKSLPKPTKEQLKVLGLSASPEQRVLMIEDKNVSEETKKKVKAAAKLNEEATSGKKEYLTDHTKIESDEQLKEALEFQLVNSKVASPLDKLITTAQFYRAYLEARADKAADPQAEIARIHELTLADLLQEISTMVSASFTAEGFGKLLCKQVGTYQSIIPAFELLKRCGKNRKTGTFRFSDEEVAAMVRVLVVWKASAQIATISKELKKLSADAEKNKDAIEQCNKEIAAEQDLMACVTEPPYDVVDNLIVAYNNEDNEMHKTAKAIVSAIIETHYKGVDIPELEFETALLNIQQRAGAVLNLFNSAVGRRDDYSEENLTDADWEEKPAEEKAEEEGKNS